MFQSVPTLGEVREAMATIAAGFDPALLSAEVCASVVADASAVEKMAATVKALAAARVADTELWRKRGDRSPAHELARKTGTSVKDASDAIATGKKLSALPAVDAAARKGELSAGQAAAIADAATQAEDPAVEEKLVAKARDSSLGELRDECLKAKAASRTQEENHRKIKSERRIRTHVDGEGGWNLHMRDTVDAGAEIMSVLRPLRDLLFNRARREGRNESSEAYAADAMVEMARLAATRTTGTASGAGGAAAAETAATAGDSTTGNSTAAPSTAGGTATDDAARTATATDDSTTGSRPTTGTPTADRPAAATAPTLDLANSTAKAPEGAAGDPPADTTGGEPPDSAAPAPAAIKPAKVIVRIDWDALIRGWPLHGETCEIAGLGPIPVSLVQTMIETGDVFLAAVVTKGVDVHTVAHLGRHPSAVQETGLQWQDPICTADGCNTVAHIQTDHRHDWADTKITFLPWLDRLCTHHHNLKTRENWSLVDGAGKRPMVPPDDPRHPANRRGEPPGQRDQPPRAAASRRTAGPPQTAGQPHRAGPDAA